MSNLLKKQIAGSFSRHSSSYDQYAQLQKISAEFLLAYIERLRPDLRKGPVLEVGCGSGLLSDILAALFADRQLYLLDMAPGMLRACRNRLEESGHDLARVHFLEMDAETITPREQYALIVSGLTVQWYNRIRESMVRLFDSLLPGGSLIFSFLGEGSFPEWAEQCARSGVPCTMNPLPAEGIMADIFQGRASTMEHWQRDITLTYPSARDFFISVKRTGAGVNVAGKTLTVRELKRLLRHWQSESPERVQVTCKVQYWLVCK